MVFGYINEKKWSLNNSGGQKINIGEYLQFYAMHQLLLEIGIPERRIVPLALEDISTYSGEEMILVLTNAARISCVPDNIHVVYIGYNNFGYEIADSAEIEFLKGLESVGCRDDHTREYLCSLGVNAYTQGCITITLPRKHDKCGEEVFLVDVPAEVVPYIPKELLDNIQIRTHEYYFTSERSESEIWRISVDQYKEYYERAGLVITSRLHLAAPCIAWGIPVILIRQNPFITFAWIDRYIPIYTLEDYSRIDWHPMAPDIENDKKIIKRDAAYNIFREYYKYVPSFDSHSLYENRKYMPVSGYSVTIIDNLKRRITAALGYSDTFSYAIWGITDNAELLYEFMREKYPNARLENAIDRYKRIQFHGLMTQSPEDVSFDNKWVFVIPTGAVQEAKTLLPGSDCAGYFFATEIFATEDDIESCRRNKE